MIYAISLFCVLLQRHSLLGLLLSFEVISLVMCLSFVCSFESMQGVVSFVLVFLCFEVCVMSVCLSLMVSFVKGVGSDYVGVSVFSGDF
uniref:NADH dehydrogenase subunit 4L n=1 Tax=Unio tumidus TaxID=143298 RepID=A0A1Q1MMN7_9BIVA|nr:NADH dehydrogenase subunit 4L [Unio tumidus]AQM37805.1 NADH dehydrogenase subunit 4L [Unio tumidus]AQM37819.1 NADH dehydrogenase subunit 4L [Unio tumidus]